MLKLFVVFLLVSVATAAAGISKRVLPFGVVEGIVDCGSNGVLGEVSLTDCTAVPCQLIPDTVYDVSIKFVASETSANLQLFIFKVGDGPPFADLPIEGEVQAGVEYELVFKLPVSPDVTGEAFDVRIYILDSDNQRVEICAEAPVEIV